MQKPMRVWPGMTAVLVSDHRRTAAAQARDENSKTLAYLTVTLVV
jgi:hypothetical protein